MRKLSSQDANYRQGLLSVFPNFKDSKYSLYEARNNAETVLKQTLSVNGKSLVLLDADRFPGFGLIKVKGNSYEEEIIYYSRKIGNQLHSLERGFSGTNQNVWPAGSKVSLPVMAEHHNAIRDAILQIQKKIGIQANPAADSINGMLTRLEKKWLAPKPVFRAYPKTGKAPLKVHFHNFSTGYGAKFLWEFGDGGTSAETNPTHVYKNNGTFTVKLNMMSAQGNQALAEKTNYIEVRVQEEIPIFYPEVDEGLSRQTAQEREEEPTPFIFVDQTDDDVIQRNWFFGDGTELTIDDPNVHTASHVYDKPGEYRPSLIISAGNKKIIRPVLARGIIVL